MVLVASRVNDVLQAGGVALLPTDTVYGLAVHPTREDAKARVFRMKRRPPDRNLPIMISGMRDLVGLGVVVTEPARRLFEAFFPGPLSLALGLRTGSAPAWLAGRVEIAVRMPDDADLLGILEMTGPLLVTSANVHGQETPPSVAEILSALAEQPDIVVDGGSRPNNVPSTLVNCNLPTPVIERSGALPDEEIARVLA